MNHEYHIIGIMSGTSLDGIDIVKCKFMKSKKWSYELENYTTKKYPKKWINILSKLHKKPNEEIRLIDIKYGEFLAENVKSFIKINNLTCDLISSHGHTIFHEPKLKRTLQIGNGNTIADITNITTVNNFRKLDIDLGGEGAPLVPIGDLLLFQEYKYCLNLGGFANISKKTHQGIIAFDVCPVNFVLNHLSRKLGKDFDEKGEIAKSGSIQNNLLSELNSIPFYEMYHPKSLSREWVESIIFPILNNYKCSIADKMHTFCEHISIQISKKLKNESCLVTGGGVFNTYLINRIANLSGSKIKIPKDEIVNYKEAIIFAFLGLLRIRDEINCLSSVTGSSRNSCTGDIYKK